MAWMIFVGVVAFERRKTKTKQKYHISRESIFKG